MLRIFNRRSPRSVEFRAALLSATLGCLAIGSTAHAQKSDDLNPDPEAERKSFKLADGWEVNLFAADPMIRKPIGINFDPRGRLWCATSETYPQIKPGDVANDKIIILEDTTGDGKADKSTVFADHLLIPEAVVPGDGGAYVTNSTEVLHFDENKTTGKGENRRVVLDGFGTEDTHHIIHTLRWGPDGRLYFNQSIYIHAHVSTPAGIRHLLGSGVWRFQPSTMSLEVFTRGLVNPWGDIWDRWGNSFQTDGAGPDGICYTFPGVGYMSAVGMDRLMTGLNPNSPKYCALESLSGRHIPEDYVGDVLTNDFRAHRVVRYKLTDSGAGFTSKPMPDFITSTDAAFRPVDIKMGPDGAVYIADLYNPIINHGEVDFRDARRDHVHGRIWRLTAKGRPLVDRPKLAGVPVTEVLEALKAPEGYTRQQAKFVLREMGTAQVLPALGAWMKSLKADDAGYEHNLLEALWTYQSLDSVEPELLARLLAAKDPQARAAAIRVAAQWGPQLEKVNASLASAVGDENPRVRLEAVRALATIATPDSITTAARVLDQPTDRFIEYALWLTANDLKDVWLPAFQAGKLTNWAKPSHLTFALQAVKSPAAISTLVNQLKTNQLPEQSRGDVINLIAAIDPANQSATLLDLAMGADIKDASTKAQLLSALELTSRQNNVRPANDPARISSLFASIDPALRGASLRLAGNWKLEQFRPDLTKLASAADTPPDVRTSALKGLAALGGNDSVAVFRQLSEQGKPEVRTAAVAALALLDLDDASKRAATLLSDEPALADPSPLLRAFVERDGGSVALAKALDGKRITPDTGKLGLRYLQSLAGTDNPLIDRFRSAVGLSNGPQKLSPDQMKQTIAEVMDKGDAARGQEVFRRKETGCYQCHSIGGAGGWLAPDLRAIGASSPVDYLVDSVLDPNKAVKDGYTGYTVITKTGDVFSGIKVRQDTTTLVLRDNAHEEIPIAVASIKKQKEVGSLMPTGLADPLTRGEFLDLIRFLSELGKPGPFAIAPNAYVRRWRALDPSALSAGSASADAANFPPEVAAASDASWNPVYSLATGVLPTDAVAAKGAKTAYVRCDVDVTAAGSIRLQLNDPKGLALWVDGRSVPVAAETSIDVTAGRHALIFRIDSAARADAGLRVEVADVPGSAAHGQPVGGK